ncbi:MAG: undecaprenyl-phosphate glucose phosphotransferase, partial [Candidatus Omnitrophica bacterium]|nr:undecaprenyl-phosphate glucose phosphotransferase [Candidatus Omnitrophota bacterium]
KRLTTLFSGLLIVNDFLMVLCAFALSYWLRFYSSFFANPLGIPSRQQYIFPALFTAIVLIVVANADGLYVFTPTKKFIDYFFKLFKNICITMFFIFAGTFFYREFTFSRSLIVLLWITMVLFLTFSRYVLRRVYIQYILPKVRKKILIIGNPANFEAFRKHTKYFRFYGEISGFISHRKHLQAASDQQCLGSIEEFEAILEKIKPDEIILATLEVPRKKIIELILESEKRLVKFKIVADLLEIMIQQFELENIEGLNLLKIKESPLNFVYNRFLKRFMDITGSFLGLILLSPVLAVVALLVKLTSVGPVLFAQERVSEEGKIFKIYKFRTMIHDAEAKTGPVFTQQQDERCTRIGSFLRRYNLDELPQLFNVVRGEMSLVGPRPERPHFVEQFKDDIPRYMSRHHVKSGITGWAQVNGLRQGTAISERVKYDLYYLENWSIWFDLKIIMLSFAAIKNAY